jgi:hypothetical protein
MTVGFGLGSSGRHPSDNTLDPSGFAKFYRLGLRLHSVSALPEAMGYQPRRNQSTITLLVAIPHGSRLNRCVSAFA